MRNPQQLPQAASNRWADVVRLVSMQALYYGAVSVDLTLTALAGLALAPSPFLATLPLTLIVAMGLVASVLTGLSVSRWGYRRIMAAGATLAVLGGLLSVLAVVQGSFALLCLGTALVGAYTATGGYIRFLAADLAPAGKQEKALSTVMYGGLLAAFAGPFAALAASHLFATEFVGAYLLVAVIGAAAIPLALSVSREPVAAQAAGTSERADAAAPAATPVSLREARRNPDFVAALIILPTAASLMTLVMAIGPLASAHAGHSDTTGTAMIQWHLVGMFAPALFSAEILRRWGPRTSTVAGGLVMLAGAVLGATSSDALPMILALTFGGIGWNLLFLSGSAYLVRTYQRGRGGRVQALAEGVTGVASVVASLGAAVVFQTLGWQSSNVPVIVLSFALVVWALLRRTAGAHKTEVADAAKDPAPVATRVEVAEGTEVGR